MNNNQLDHVEDEEEEALLNQLVSEIVEPVGNNKVNKDNSDNESNSTTGQKEGEEGEVANTEETASSSISSSTTVARSKDDENNKFVFPVPLNAAVVDNKSAPDAVKGEICKNGISKFNQPCEITIGQQSKKNPHH